MKPAKPRARRHTAKEHGPDPVDLHVGRQLRQARELAGLTQAEIGRKLDMSFQVVQKYEQGEIRVSASRLLQLAMVLEKPISYLFEGLEATGAAAPTIGRREIELVRAFRLISAEEIRRRLLQLVKGMALPPGDPEP